MTLEEIKLEEIRKEFPGATIEAMHCPGWYYITDAIGKTWWLSPKGRVIRGSSQWQNGAEQ